MNKRASANIYILISIVLGYVLSAIVNDFYADSLNSATAVNVMNIINVTVITVIPILIFVFADRITFAGMFKKLTPGKWINYLFIIPVLWSSATYLNSRMNIFLGKFGIEIIEQIPPAKELDAVIAGFILTCIAAPVLEEIFYRGVILSLLKGYGAGGAVAVSAILFALAHGSLTVLVSPLVFGLVLGYIVIRSGSIFPAIFIHFGCNLISWLILNFELGQKPTIVINLSTVIIGAAGTIWAVVKIIKEKETTRKVLKQTWEYVKNPLWLPIVANYIYINFINHG